MNNYVRRSKVAKNISKIQLVSEIDTTKVYEPFP